MTATAERAWGEGDRSVLLARWLPWLLGLAAALVFVPLDYLDGSAARLQSPEGDLRQHLVALRAYLAEDWHWPLLQVERLHWPEGANLIYADVIPGLALLTKLWQSLTGQAVNYFGAWIFASFLLQPVAAAFLLRSLGVLRPLTLLAGCLLILALPVFPHRVDHPVLQAHWLLLLALGLALRTARGAEPRRSITWLAVKTLMLLFVNAYLYAMAAVLLAGATAEALRRGAFGWRAAALCVGGWLALSAILLWFLGYLAGAADGWGYGYYSMNLVSPILPQRSSLLPHYAQWVLGGSPAHQSGDVVDATGFQRYEGYNYLGLGALLLLLLAVALGWRRLWPALRRQPFVIAAAVALGVFALSNVVWLGYGRLVVLPEPPAILQQFRSTGRVVWPLAYLLLAGGTALLAAARPRAALLLLPLVALVQLADLQFMATRAYERMRAAYEPLLPQEPWRALIARHALVRVYPSYECRGYWQRLLMEVVSLAVDARRPVTVMYLSRLPARDCEAEAQERATLKPSPDELVVLFERSKSGAAPPPPSAELAPHCRRFIDGQVCTTRWDELPPEVSAAFP
jgi:hypothetical protein